MDRSARSVTEARSAGFTTVWKTIPSGARPQPGLKRLLQRLVKVIVWAYLRVFHDFAVRYHPGVPQGRAYIAVINHTSALDVPALMAGDPYDPPTSMVIKAEMTRVPLLSRVLRFWGAVPVERHGQDIAAIRQIKRILAEGRGICVAPAGTRSVDGRLGPINPVLARLIVQCDAAVFPVVIVGARECLPKGAKLPRRGRITVESGAEIDLRPYRGRRLSTDDLAAVAALIQNAIADLLPDHMKPDPAAPVLATYAPGA
ncbi:MAG: 1-acyl-sn-glycerol-3-phosphate acyltransferase [Chloroflexi bacterium]|nr:1-acyl-sn-glycerol-3-phosphate acyltransferase [Chloroflexota bacterium]